MHLLGRLIGRRFLTTAAPASTIYALSSAPGRAAISIVRIAGDQSLNVLERLRAPNPSSRPSRAGRAIPSHQAKVATLYNSQNMVLDEALVLYFAGPHSYTGDDLVELHLHGSPAVVAAVTKAIRDTNLARYAEPGEFTKRAFYNGRLDLAKVEGIRDLIEADTELQRQAAIAGASGQLSEKYARWRTAIVKNTAMLTALIDFADDNELETTSKDLLLQVKTAVSAILREVEQVLTSVRCSELVQSGIKLALLGPPNAGKSSLVNKLVDRAASIVSDVPGTTRDVVEVSLDIGGYKVLIGDTAGIRDIEAKSDHEKIEMLGIERARQVIDRADIVLAVLPADQLVNETIRDQIEKAKDAGKHVIVVANKADLGTVNAEGLEVQVSLSCLTGQGMTALIEQLHLACKDLTAHGRDGNLLGASQRTQDLLENAVVPGLAAAIDMLDRGDAMLASAELQLAVDGIGKITGQGITVNEVLGVVFGSFCIGK